MTFSIPNGNDIQEIKRNLVICSTMSPPITYILIDYYTPTDTAYHRYLDNFSVTCEEDESCSRECDVCCQLPYNNETGTLIVSIMSLTRRHVFA